MAKYHKLVKEYEGWIKNLKEDKATLARLQESWSQAQHLNPDDAGFSDAVEDWLAAGDLDDEIRFVENALYDDICREYELVPFRQAQQEGINGFYREAGLQRP